jgi:hypothetical protein
LTDLLMNLRDRVKCDELIKQGDEGIWKFQGYHTDVKLKLFQRSKLSASSLVLWYPCSLLYTKEAAASISWESTRNRT